MRAAVWHGQRDVQVDTVPDPSIQEPTDAIIRVTSTGHLRVRPPPLRGDRRRSSTPGDILGHEPMGIVEAVGTEVTDLAVGDRVVVPFNISCGHCCMCDAAACSPSARPRRSATRARAPRCSATPSSTARCPAARPSTCGCRRRSTGRSRCPTGRPTTGSCTSPTCCPPPGRRCEYADVPDGGIARRARARADRRDGVSHRPPPRRRPGHRGRPRPRATRTRPPRTASTSLDLRDVDDDAALGEAIRERTAGRGPDCRDRRRRAWRPTARRSARPRSS